MSRISAVSSFPINTVVLVALLSILLAATTWFVVAEGLSRINLSRTRRRTSLAIAGAVLTTWFVGRLGLAVFPPGGAFLTTPAVVGLTVIGLLIGLLPLLWAPFRQAIRAIPMSWLIAVHIGRFAGGGNFVTLLDAGLLPANFALPAGYGDIFVSILSLPAVYFAVTRRAVPRSWVVVWLSFGFLDFISAFATGGRFIGPFAANLAALGGPATAINFVLIIPTFIVPILASIQFYVIYQLVSGSEQVDHAGSNPHQG